MLELLASILLGCTMCVAGATKIRMGAQWPVDARQLGVPRVASLPVPWIEVATGALLVAQWHRRALAGVVIVLLAMFTGVIIDNLRRGRRPTCACFGQWRTRPVGWGHVIRNIALVGLGVVIVF